MVKRRNFHPSESRPAQLRDEIARLEKSFHDPPDNLQADESIYTGRNIVHHNSDTAVQMGVKPGNWKRFDDIEEPEQYQACYPGCRMIRCQRQGDEYTENFIDNNAARVGLVEDLFCRSRSKKTENKKRNEQYHGL